MMKQFSLLLTVLFLCACKQPEARKPISVKSGSFIDVSVKRNKELLAKEEAEILRRIALDSTINYKASEKVDFGTTITLKPKSIL